MRNIPVDLSGYKLIVTEAPVMKTRKGEDGQTEEIVTDRDGVALFVVSLLPKSDGERGEEIKVTLTTDPTAQGEDFDFGARVELIGATVSPYSFKNARGEVVSGIAFKAQGLKPLG